MTFALCADTAAGEDSGATRIDAATTGADAGLNFKTVVGTRYGFDACESCCLISAGRFPTIDW